MKQALLVIIGGQMTEHEAKERVLKAFAGEPIQLRQFGYNPSNPEEVTYHSGKWFRFLGNGEPSIETEEAAQNESFRKIITRELKPLLREMWYGPKKEDKPSASA